MEQVIVVKTENIQMGKDELVLVIDSKGREWGGVDKDEPTRPLGRYTSWVCLVCLRQIRDTERAYYRPEEAVHDSCLTWPNR